LHNAKCYHYFHSCHNNIRLLFSPKGGYASCASLLTFTWLLELFVWEIFSNDLTKGWLNSILVTLTWHLSDFTWLHLTKAWLFTFTENHWWRAILTKMESRAGAANRCTATEILTHKWQCILLYQYCRLKRLLALYPMFFLHAKHVLGRRKFKICLLQLFAEHKAQHGILKFLTWFHVIGL